MNYQLIALRDISSTLKKLVTHIVGPIRKLANSLHTFSRRYIQVGGPKPVLGLHGQKTMVYEFLDLVTGKVEQFTKSMLAKMRGLNLIQKPKKVHIQQVFQNWANQIPRYTTRLGAFFGGIKVWIEDINNTMKAQAPRFTKFTSHLSTLVGPKMLGNVMGEIRSLAPQMMAFSLVTAPAQAALSGFLDVFSPITDIFEGFGMQLSQAFIPIVQIVADMLLQFMPTLGLIAQLLAPIITLVASVLLEPLRLLADVLKILNPYIEIAVHAVSRFLQPIIDWIRQSSFLKSIIMEVVDAIKTLIGWFSDLKNGMEEAGENIKGFFGNIGNDIKGWFD